MARGSRFPLATGEAGNLWTPLAALHACPSPSPSSRASLRVPSHNWVKEARGQKRSREQEISWQAETGGKGETVGPLLLLLLIIWRGRGGLGVVVPPLPLLLLVHNNCRLSLPVGVPPLLPPRVHQRKWRKRGRDAGRWAWCRSTHSGCGGGSWLSWKASSVSIRCCTLQKSMTAFGWGSSFCLWCRLGSPISRSHPITHAV
mmetsp:Transcript_8841/g.17266  ORF Transcript_8841/g.17266 Transcript_8841/m.17266 type:complete len:202 (-) Transcript_8841:205-810(-)